MTLLLDTHMLLASVREELAQQYPKHAVLVEEAEGPVFVSVASIWEIAIKNRLGKLQLPFPLDAISGYVSEAGFSVLPVELRHVLTEIEPIPATRDPFDRLLLAQCKVDRMRLVTIDRALADHPLAARV